MLKPFTLSFFASEWSVSASGGQRALQVRCVYIKRKLRHSRATASGTKLYIR